MVSETYVVYTFPPAFPDGYEAQFCQTLQDAQDAARDFAGEFPVKIVLRTTTVTETEQPL